MGRKLLVADDSVTIQKVIKLALSSEGYDILAVSDGKEAIRAIQEERPDVVLIDIALTGADAYEVKRAVNQNPKVASTGFILMASAFERMDEKTISDLGFHARLIKPFDPSHLRKAVSELMAKLSTLPPPIIAAAPVAVPPPPQPPEPPLDAGGDDLPPVKDMHPLVNEEPTKTSLTEDDFHSDLIETPEPTQRIEVPPPPAPPADLGDDEEEEEAVATQTLENDIKNLTESTIKMSGLDDFQWSLDDSKKMKAPEEVTKPTGLEKKPVSLKTLITAPSKPIDDGGSNFPFTTSKAESSEPRVQAPTIKPPPDSNLVSGRDYVAPTIELKREATNPGMAMPLSRAEMEQLVRKELHDTLQKMLQDIVPQIAENVIRKEIERILAEP